MCLYIYICHILGMGQNYNYSKIWLQFLLRTTRNTTEYFQWFLISQKHRAMLFGEFSIKHPKSLYIDFPLSCHVNSDLHHMGLNEKTKVKTIKSKQNKAKSSEGSVCDGFKCGQWAQPACFQKLALAQVTMWAWTIWLTSQHLLLHLVNRSRCGMSVCSMQLVFSMTK